MKKRVSIGQHYGWSIFFFFSCQDVRPASSSRVSHRSSSHIRILKIFHFFFFHQSKGARIWRKTRRRTRKAVERSRKAKPLSFLIREKKWAERARIAADGRRQMSTGDEAWISGAWGVGVRYLVVLAADTAGSRSRGHGACRHRVRGILGIRNGSRTKRHASY